MKKHSTLLALVVAVIFLAAFTSSMDKKDKVASQKNVYPVQMNMYVIEREIPGLGNWSQEELKAASQKSCVVLKELAPHVEWIQSYVTGDKMYCIYRAENEEYVREHAKRGGFPANSVAKVTGIISPETAK